MTTTMVDMLQKHPNMLHLSKFQATLTNSRSTYILAFWGAFFGYMHYDNLVVRGSVIQNFQS